MDVKFLSFVALNPSNPAYNADCRIRDFSLLEGYSIRPYISIGFRR
jgi:hypothetical protein